MASVFKRGGKNNRGGYYYVSWTDHNGKRRTLCTLTTDKKTAEEIASKYENDRAVRVRGVIDPALDAILSESKRTIEEHVKEFDAKMTAAGCSDDHVSRTKRIVTEFAAFAEITTSAAITADAANRYANTLKDAGRSNRTRNAHLTALKSFTAWLAENSKLPRDPLLSVEKPNPKADRRRKRRLLLQEEWHRLETATVNGPERFDIGGSERALLYRTALQTGLRSNELRSLKPGTIIATVDKPFILCDAGSTKNKQQARQYIDERLAADLMAHVATKAPQAPVFAMPEKTEVAEMIREDLAAARAAWIKEAIDDPQEYARREQSEFLAAKNHDGDLFDFHTLRHACGAWLALDGAHPKVIQTVMRHSAITLTMDTYGHLFPGQESDAAAGLHAMMTPQINEVRRTGTDDATARVIPFNAQRPAQRAGRETMRRSATPHNEPNSVDRVGDDRKSQQLANLCDATRDDATECESRPGVIRTHDQGIMSPLL